MNKVECLDCKEEILIFEMSDFPEEMESVYGKILQSIKEKHNGHRIKIGIKNSE